MAATELSAAGSMPEPAPVEVPAVRVRDLLYARWRTVRNFPRSQREGGWVRILVLVALGAFVWAGIFGASYWFIGKTMALEPFGEILVRKILSMAFVVIFAVLCFSNLIAAFSTYLLADELQFLMPRPLPHRTVFSARFIETLVQSSWMVLLFGLPIFLAAGIRFDAPGEYYGWLAAVLVPFVVIPTALASIVVIVLANVMPVERTREIFVAIGLVAFVALFAMLRELQPEQLFRPDKFGSTMEFFATLQTPGRYWLPSSWAIELLYPSLTADSFRGISWLHVACLYSTAGGLFFLAAWTHRILHFRAYSRAQQGRHNEVQGDPRERRRRRDSSKKSPMDKVRAWADRNADDDRALGPVSAIARKDLLIFARDTVQWSQLLLLVGLVVVYLVNIRSVGDFGAGGIFGPIGIYFLNIGLSAFLVAAVSVRLVFPAVSLEGKAFWLVRRAPIGLHRYLAAKWIGHTPNLLILALVLVVLSNWVIGTALWLSIKSALLVGCLVVALTGLGVGMGAMFPRFHIDDAARIATGLGGVLFMFIAIGLTGVVVALDAWPTFHLMRVELGFRQSLQAGFWWRAVLAWLGVIVLCFGTGALAIHLGARRLARR